MTKDIILITGVAGFIGSSLASELLQRNYTVVGIDALIRPDRKKSNYKNLELLTNYTNFYFYNEDIRSNNLLTVFKKHNISKVVHLAALAGVRTSITNADLYFDINVNGTKNIYQIASDNHVKRFIFASSSSVYGNSNKIPFSESQKLFPKSPYAKSKRDAERFIKNNYKKHKISCIILRFFSVYGPRGRSDMAPYLFTKAAFNAEVIKQYGQGNSARDYTYISDIVNGIIKSLEVNLKYEIINLGNSRPILLSDLVTTIETITNRKIVKKILPANATESFITYADIRKAKKLLDWEPRIELKQGMKNFIDWYKNTQL